LTTQRSRSWPDVHRRCTYPGSHRRPRHSVPPRGIRYGSSGCSAGHPKSRPASLVNYNGKIMAKDSPRCGLGLNGRRPTRNHNGRTSRAFGSPSPSNSMEYSHAPSWPWLIGADIDECGIIRRHIVAATSAEHALTELQIQDLPHPSPLLLSGLTAKRVECSTKVRPMPIFCLNFRFIDGNTRWLAPLPPTPKTEHRSRDELVPPQSATRRQAPGAGPKARETDDPPRRVIAGWPARL
jgi:hypothetical protein